MHAVSASTQSFSLLWQGIIFLLRLLLVANLGRCWKYRGICYRICQKCSYADIFDEEHHQKKNSKSKSVHTLKNPFLHILPVITFKFSVTVKLMLVLSVANFLMHCLHERLKLMMINIFVIWKVWCSNFGVNLKS